MKKSKCLTLLIIVGGSWNLAFAQRNTVGAGGDASGSGGSVSYSIGQIDYKTASGSGGAATLGNQQPYEIINLTGVDEKTISLFYALYPNPTSSNLTLEVTDIGERKLRCMVLTMEGKTLAENEITQEKSVVDLNSYAKGVYLINVLDNRSLVKSFKIIKN